MSLLEGDRNKLRPYKCPLPGDVCCTFVDERCVVTGRFDRETLLLLSIAGTPNVFVEGVHI